MERLRTDNHKGERAELFKRDRLLYLVGYFYAGDEAEALAVCRRMQDMCVPFAGESRIKLVGVSMAPDLDTPESSIALRKSMVLLGMNGFSFLVIVIACASI